MSTSHNRSRVSDLTPEQFLDHFEQRLASLMEQVERTDVWQAIVAPDADPELARETMKQIYLEIFSYQQEGITAAIATIGQMPRSMNPRDVRSMLIHQSEEFDHGEMALRDYIGLGGDEHFARTRDASPASFAVSAIWWMFERMRKPFAYLGALYLFEALTPTVAAAAGDSLKRLGLPRDTMEFLEFHAVKDIEHTNLVRYLIAETIRNYPEAAEQMDHGLSCFLHVYPVPVWETAFERAKATLAARTESSAAA